MLAPMLGICALWASQTARASSAGPTSTAEDTWVDTSPQAMYQAATTLRISALVRQGQRHETRLLAGRAVGLARRAQRTLSVAAKLA